MSELISHSPDVPFDHAAFAARQEALLNDRWRFKLIDTVDFSGKVLSKSTARDRWGDYSEDAPLPIKLSRLLDMAAWARGLTNGPGLWVDSVLKQIRSLARDIANCSPRWPQQRAGLEAKYLALVNRTEIELENVIRASLGMDGKPFENMSAGLNFRTQGGGLQQPMSRREVEKAETWTAAAFVGRLIAWGVTIRRNAETGGLVFVGAAALTPADGEVLNDRLRMAGIELYLGQHPELCEPTEAIPSSPIVSPAPPPAPIAQIVQEVEEVEEIEAIPSSPKDIEPAEAEAMRDTVEPEGPVATKVEAGMATRASPAAPATTRKRRHRFA